MDKFDSIVGDCFHIAQGEALNRKNPELTSGHFLWGMASHPKSVLNSSAERIKNNIQEELEKLPVCRNISQKEIKISRELSECFTLALTRAIQSGREEITQEDILIYLMKHFPHIPFSYEKKNQNERPSFLIDLNQKATEGKLDPVIGREREIRSVMEILGRRRKNNPVLTGAAGVGKTAIVEGLADAIVKENVPDILQGKTIYALDMGLLMAGTKFQGEFEDRIQRLLKFIQDKAGQGLLFIDEIHQLVGAGKTSGAMDAANLLKPALARGDLHCIGATTHEEYQKYILGDSALDRRFRSIFIESPSKEETIQILMGIREKLEMHHGIKISDEAVYKGVMLSDRYITNKNFPDKAIDLIDEASSALKLNVEAMPSKLVELESHIKSKKTLAQVEKDNTEIQSSIKSLEKEYEREKDIWSEKVFTMKKSAELKNKLDRFRFELEQMERKQDYEGASRLKYSLIPEVEKELNGVQNDLILSPREIAMVVSRQTGIPLEKILQSRQDRILKLEGYLKKNILGQNQSLTALAQALVASHAGLTDPGRPLGSFLLKGPSGVGKTETAKATARFLFNTEKNLIRLDMSEYSEKHSVAKLIGSPAGYVGYEEGGLLTEAVRCRPYAVVLFDEIEKAHLDFMDILLQVLDEGFLTDNKGRRIDFKNTIVMMTTNSRDLRDFKTEVLGRIDEVLEYGRLDRSVMDALVDRQISFLNERLLSNDISIEIDKDLREDLMDEGYDVRFGARPLQAIFHKKIICPAAKMILSSRQKTGRYLLKKKKDGIINISGPYWEYLGEKPKEVN